MDWVVGGFLLVGFLFFWAVWIFGYWLPMAKEAQRDFKRQQEREKALAEAEARAAGPGVAGSQAPPRDPAGPIGPAP